MAEMKDKLVNLKDLKAVYGELNNKIPTRPFLTEDLSDSSVTMDKLAQDVKDAIGSGGSGGGGVNEDTIRNIVNNQIAKLTFTINDDGHLMVTYPE